MERSLSKKSTVNRKCLSGLRALVGIILLHLLAFQFLLREEVGDRMLSREAKPWLKKRSMEEKETEPLHLTDPDDHTKHEAVAGPPLNIKEECEKDIFGFKPVLSKITIAPQRKNAPKILCVVNTIESHHYTKVKAVLDTWGSKCDDIIFASSKTDPSIRAIRIEHDGDYSYDDLWSKHRETLRYVYDTYKDEYDWFFKADDDTYVIMENLKSFLGSEEIQKQHEQGLPLHIGNPWALHVDESGVHSDNRTVQDDVLAQYLEKANYRFMFNVGGAGYAMNKAFMADLMNWIDKKECAPTKSISTLLDDTLLSLCSANFGAFPYNNTRDSLGQERFHQDSPSYLYNAKPSDSLYQEIYKLKRFSGGYQVGEDCCSSESITFHRLDPLGMRVMHNLLYSCVHEPVDQHDVKILDPEEVLRSSSSWPPLATALRIADEQLRIIILIVNCGMLDFADNLIMSMLQFGVTNFVIVPRDDIAYHVLQKSYTDNVVPPMPDVSADSSVLQYGTDAFNEFNTVRPTVISAFLNLGLSVMYTDVDMVWQSNILDKMEEGMTNETEAMFVKDDGPYYDAFCSCLFFVKPTSQVITLMDHWAGGFQPNEDDQPIFNRAIEQLEDQLRYQSYSKEDGFPSGYQYWNESDSEAKSKAFVVHNNWIKGKWRKFYRFEKAGLWKPTGRIPSNAYNCDTHEVQPLDEQLQLVDDNIAPAPVVSSSMLCWDNAKRTQNRTLVVLLGNARGGDPTWRSLYGNLLDPNEADLALLLGTSDDRTPSLYSRAKYLWEAPEYEDWSSAIDDLFGTSPADEFSWRHIAKATSPSGPFAGTKEDPTSGGFINRLLSLYLHERIVSAGLLDKYDRFVITRTDQYYPCPLDLSKLDPTKVWVPTGEDWGGICDRFVIVGKEHVLSLLDVIRPAILNPEKYYSFRGNVESFVKLRWIENGIFGLVRRFRRAMFTASIPDDTANWLPELRRPAFKEDGLTIHYKYEDEYYQAMSSCAGALTVSKPKHKDRCESMGALAFESFPIDSSDNDHFGHQDERELPQEGHTCSAFISGPTLVNADANTELFELVGNPALIDLTPYAGEIPEFNIAVKTSSTCQPSPIQSVLMIFNKGHASEVRTCDSQMPYSVFGDHPGGHYGYYPKTIYDGITLPLGVSTVKARGFARPHCGQGAKTAVFRRKIEVSIFGYSDCPGAVTGFDLIDTDANTKVTPLFDGDVICVPSHKFDFEAKVLSCKDEKIESVKLEVDGPERVTDNPPFYIACGDEGDLFDYTLTATPFSGTNKSAKGGQSRKDQTSGLSKTISFSFKCCSD